MTTIEHKLQDEKFMVYFKDQTIEVWSGQFLFDNLIYKYSMMNIDKDTIIQELSEFFVDILEGKPSAINWAASFGVEYIPRFIN